MAVRVWMLSVVHTRVLALFPFDAAGRLPGEDMPENAERTALDGGE